MSKAVPASPVPGAKNTSAKPSNSNKGPRWCRWIGLFAVPVLVTALSYTSAPLFHWLRQCIDPYPHASGGAAGTFYAYPHPWYTNPTHGAWCGLCGVRRISPMHAATNARLLCCPAAPPYCMCSNSVSPSRHNNGTRDCFDTRLTRLTRWLFAREFAPEIHNDRNRFVIDGLLSEARGSHAVRWGMHHPCVRCPVHAPARAGGVRQADLV